VKPKTSVRMTKQQTKEQCGKEPKHLSLKLFLSKISGVSKISPK
jgi:hypothetical protein